jgi:CAAX prenyl protease-like protein
LAAHTTRNARAGRPTVPYLTPDSRFPFFARVAPFAAFIALLALQLAVPLGDHGQQWLVALRGVVVAALLATFWRDYTELKPVPGTRFNAQTCTWYMFAVVAGLAVFVVWICFDHGWATVSSTSNAFAPIDAGGHLDISLVALRLFGLVLVVPLMEELFWRSFFMRWIDARDFLSRDPRRASLAAFALSSALFATEHSLWFAGLVAGAVYAGLYMLSRNLWVPIVSHAVTNGALGAWILATGSWHLW